MNEIILHHFDASPFAEKARLALGIKNLSWHSVDIPMIMPKPQLMPLTGGYRKTPVMQIGADIYCDSNLIMDELEQRFPNPSLYPYGGKGLAVALANWSDVNFFQPGAGLSMGMNQGLPEPLLNDRKAFFKFMDFDNLDTSLSHLYAQFLSQMDLLEMQLLDGENYLGGQQVGAVDILGYFPLWMARGNFPAVDQWLQQFPTVLKWEQRMQAVGHGIPQSLSADEALQQAKSAQPSNKQAVQNEPSALVAGQVVSVVPTDYGEVPVTGKLMQLSNQRIVIQREDQEVGLTNNHFPRSGFRVEGK